MGHRWPSQEELPNSGLSGHVRAAGPLWPWRWGQLQGQAPSSWHSQGCRCGDKVATRETAGPQVPQGKAHSLCGCRGAESAWDGASSGQGGSRMVGRKSQPAEASGTDPGPERMRGQGEPRPPQPHCPSLLLLLGAGPGLPAAPVPAGGSA